MISVSVPTFGSAGVCVCIIFFAMYFLLLRVRRTRKKSFTFGDRFEIRDGDSLWGFDSPRPLPSFRHETQLHFLNQSNNQHGNVNPPYADRCRTLTSHSSIFWCFLSCPILPRLPHSIALATCCQSNILFLLYHEFFKLCNNNKTLGKTSIILTKIKINQEGITCSSNAC